MSVVVPFLFALDARFDARRFPVGKLIESCARPAVGGFEIFSVDCDQPASAFKNSVRLL